MLDYLLSGLLMRIIAISARLAITPILPRLVRMIADIFWSCKIALVRREQWAIFS